MLVSSFILLFAKRQQQKPITYHSETSLFYWQGIISIPQRGEFGVGQDNPTTIITILVINQHLLQFQGCWGVFFGGGEPILLKRTCFPMKVISRMKLPHTVSDAIFAAASPAFSYKVLQFLSLEKPKLKCVNCLSHSVTVTHANRHTC